MCTSLCDGTARVRVHACVCVCVYQQDDHSEWSGEIRPIQISALSLTTCNIDEQGVCRSSWEGSGNTARLTERNTQRERETRGRGAGAGKNKDQRQRGGRESE